jgi:hypothetical protein
MIMTIRAAVMAAAATGLLLGACDQRETAEADRRLDAAAERTGAVVDDVGDRAEALTDRTVEGAEEAASDAAALADKAGDRIEGLAEKAGDAAERTGDRLAAAGRELDRDASADREARP